ncbi:protein Daple-like [Synchiropus splendidus]|uniref:protein Daple-like n=1 Tax=Synchiropus splendidus TaxID=270530 RepID=UPI00237DC54C|nr:protein Daple-like [Synchiropus splendidus]
MEPEPPGLAEHFDCPTDVSLQSPGLGLHTHLHTLTHCPPESTCVLTGFQSYPHPLADVSLGLVEPSDAPCTTRPELTDLPCGVSRSASNAVESPSDVSLGSIGRETQSPEGDIGSLSADVANITLKVEDLMEVANGTLEEKFDELCDKVQRLHNLLDTQQESGTLTHDQAEVEAQVSGLLKIEKEMATLRRNASTKQECLYGELGRLKVNQMICQEHLSAELEAEKEKTSVICQELEKMTMSHQELEMKCQSLEIQNVRLQTSLDSETSYNKDRLQSEIQSLQSLRVEKEALLQKMAEDLVVLKCKAAVQQESLRKQENKLRKAELLNNESLKNELQTERSKTTFLTQEMEKVKITQQELLLKCESVERRVTDLQLKLDAEIKTHEERLHKDITGLRALRMEKEALRQHMVGEKVALQIDSTMTQQCLLTELEELKEAKIVSQENVTVELQSVRGKNLLLSQELMKVSCRNRELSFKNEVAEKKVAQLKEKIDARVKGWTERFQTSQLKLQVWTTKKEAVLQKMMDEMVVLQRDAALQQQSLLKDVEMLREAHIFNQQKYKVELQAEREKNAFLKEELKNITSAHQDLITECARVQQQAASLQQDLDTAVKQQAETVRENSELIQSLRFEKGALRQKMIDKMAVLQNEAADKEKSLLLKLEELKNCQIFTLPYQGTVPQLESPTHHLHEELKVKCETLEQQVLMLQNKLDMETKSHTERVERNKQVIQASLAEKEILQRKVAENKAQKTESAKRNETLLQEVDELKSLVEATRHLHFDFSCCHRAELSFESTSTSERSETSESPESGGETRTGSPRSSVKRQRNPARLKRLARLFSKKVELVEISPDLMLPGHSQPPGVIVS